MEDSKECFKCNTIKPFSEFYRHKGMADGYLNKCKECNKKDVKENRIKNIEYYLEYDRSRSMIPKRVEARNLYAKTEQGKKSINKCKKNWKEKNLVKQSAIYLVNNAIRDGKLEKSYICEQCNASNVRIHGHHDNYAYLLSVRWLCSKCHVAWHKEHGSALNG